MIILLAKQRRVEAELKRPGHSILTHSIRLYQREKRCSILIKACLGRPDITVLLGLEWLARPVTWPITWPVTWPVTWPLSKRQFLHTQMG